MGKSKESSSNEKINRFGTTGIIIGAIIIIILAILVFIPKGKNDNSTAPSPTPTIPAESDQIESTSWKLVTYLREGQSVPMPENVEVTLVVDGNDYSGNSICNSYFGSFTVQSDDNVTTIEMSPIGSTKKACIDESLMDFESQYLKTLGEISSFSTYEDTGLTLYSGTEGKTALSYEKME